VARAITDGMKVPAMPAEAIKGRCVVAADLLPSGTTIKGRLSGSGAGAAEPGRGVKLK
jgi:hypothetical protein